MPVLPHAVELDLPLGHVAQEQIRPMLPMPAAEPFDSVSHCFEVAWDGVRALASVDGGGLRLWGRTLRDLTRQYPETQLLQELLPLETVVDGELIVPDQAGRPDFSALQERQHSERPASVERAVRLHPVTYVVYDLLYLRGRSLLREPLHRRRALLRETLRTSGRIYVPESVQGEGIAFFEAAQENGLQGIVAKRLDGLYHQGRRHPDWLLVQAVRREDFVVLGYQPGSGGRLLDALIVGSYDGSRFRPVGKVVGGYDEAAARRLRQRLDNVPTGQAPRGERWANAQICWVEPRVVVLVKFSEWDAAGQLRFPIYCGTRPEVAPEECVRLPLVSAERPRRERFVIHLPSLPL
jgi:DNA ligase D-like protein (predicted ligase)